MVRKYHDHKPQTNPWHREEEQHDHHETPGRQTIHPGVRTRDFDLKSRLICFIIVVPLCACEISVKILTTELLQNLNFDL